MAEPQHPQLEVWSFYPGDPELFRPSEVAGLHEALGIGREVEDVREAYALLTENEGLDLPAAADRPFFSAVFTIGGSEREKEELWALIEEQIEKLPPYHSDDGPLA